MSESDWIFPDPDFIVRQGDILLRRDPLSGKILETCLVITADCDISKNKFGSHLACLNVDFLSGYVRSDWARVKLEKAIANASGKLRDQIAKWHATKLGRASNLTVQGVDDWISRESADSICQSLDIPAEKLKDIKAAINSYKDALVAKNNIPEADFLTQLVHFKAILSKKTIGDSLAETLTQARGESLPEDVFLLPSIPQLEKSAALIKLREIIAVEFGLVKYRATDASSALDYLRVGRLQPALKYAVSQAFGALYSKIGLSKEFEDRHKKAIDSLLEIELETL